MNTYNGPDNILSIQTRFFSQFYPCKYILISVFFFQVRKLLAIKGGIKIQTWIIWSPLRERREWDGGRGRTRMWWEVGMHSESFSEAEKLNWGLKRNSIEKPTLDRLWGQGKDEAALQADKQWHPQHSVHIGFRVAEELVGVSTSLLHQTCPVSGRETGSGGLTLDQRLISFRADHAFLGSFFLVASVVVTFFPAVCFPASAASPLWGPRDQVQAAAFWLSNPKPHFHSALPRWLQIPPLTWPPTLTSWNPSSDFESIHSCFPSWVQGQIPSHLDHSGPWKSPPSGFFLKLMLREAKL